MVCFVFSLANERGVTGASCLCNKYELHIFNQGANNITFFLKDFIYSTERKHKQGEGEREREKQVPC